jgi:hypothetical protein
LRSVEMPKTVVIKGRVVGPSTVELEQPLPERTREVEVVARVADQTVGKLSDYLRGLPPGTRSKEDIDQQIREERNSWS